MFHFGAFAIWGTLATLLVLPVLPLLVVSAAAAGFVGLASGAAAQVVGWPGWLAAGYTNGATRLFGGLPPGAVETGPWAGWASAALYGAAGLWLLRRPLAALVSSGRKSITALRLRPAPPGPAPTWVLVLVLAVAGVAVAGAATARPDGLLQVTFLETDRGDAIFIETPDRVQALVDGGRSADTVGSELEERLPFWDRSLDLVLLTHGDQDHVGGLARVLERYRVGMVADAPVGAVTVVYREWLALAAAHSGRTVLTGGETVLLGRDVAFDVLSAGPEGAGGSDNDAGVVARLRYRGVSVLLTADISAAAEERLLAGGSVVSSTVLKVAHHGSKGSSSQSFLEAVSPAVAVVQSGPNDPFGHPHDEALSRLQSVTRADQVYLTRDRGSVTVVTDGRRLWVETER
jgi:competence protein ComEC